jgi:DNA-binding SARP family transcriptional activator/tetratricopeptide (TPR) repeat protein
MAVGASMRLQMGCAHLALLGGFSLRDPAGRDIAIGSRKAQALLAVLGVACPGAVGRERLIGMLWAEHSQERARHSLRQTLSELRRDVPSLIVVRGDALALDPAACTVDVAAFRHLAAADDAASLDRASQLYGGALADGLAVREEGFEEWLRTESTQLAGLAGATMARLASGLAESGDHPSAVAVLQRWLALDPACEDAHRRLIEALAAVGRHSAAQQQYQLCRDVLMRDLGVEPSAQTVAVFEAIRTRDAAVPSPGLSAGRSARHPALAVLPFGVSAGHADLEPTARSISADLTALLARASGWEVAAWQSALAGAAVSADPRALGQALGVRYLVSGQLRRMRDGRLRLNVELVECEDARHLWSAQEEFPSLEQSDEVDAVVASLAGRLEPQLNLAELRWHSARPALPQDAWTMLRIAMGALFARGWSEAAVGEAVDSFRRSATADPDFALAHAYKSLLLALGAKMGLVKGEALLDEARRDAERALSLQPRDSEVLGYAGCALADLGDPARAEPLLERAVEENPDNPQAWAALGACRLMLGRVDSGIDCLRRGLRVSPSDYRRSVWLTLLASGLLRQRQGEEAIASARAACRSDANFYPARIVLAGALLRAGQKSEAARALLDARRIRPQMQLGELRLWVGGRGQRELAAFWRD